MTITRTLDEIRHMANSSLPVRSADVRRIFERIDELEAALKPFSDEASWWFTNNYNDDVAPVEGFEDYQSVMTCGDLFNARTILNKET